MIGTAGLGLLLAVCWVLIAVYINRSTIKVVNRVGSSVAKGATDLIGKIPVHPFKGKEDPQRQAEEEQLREDMEAVNYYYTPETPPTPPAPIIPEAAAASVDAWATSEEEIVVREPEEEIAAPAEEEEEFFTVFPYEEEIETAPRTASAEEIPVPPLPQSKIGRASCRERVF